MFSNTITFSADKHVLDDKEVHPTPIKVNVPQWFKKLPSKENVVKNCMPFLDALTTGYCLKVTADIEVDFNNEETNQTSSKSSYAFDEQFCRDNGINGQTNSEAVHPRTQLEGSPLVNKNNCQTVQKIIYPFTIQTPKGYSCLFVPPLNNRDERFEIISGIVDTDSYPLEINFPYTLNGDKFERFTTTIKKGTVFAQVIPFKRESWKMKFINKLRHKKISNHFWYKWLTMFQHKYKKYAWKKKTFY